MASERIPQSVAKLWVFRAFLASDGVTPATGKTIGVQISKNGATSFSNPNAGALDATEMAAGFYKAAFDTTDAGTLGPLTLRGTEASILDVGDVWEVTTDFASIGVAVRDVPNSGGAAAGSFGETSRNADAKAADIQSRIPAALTGGGNIKADALKIDGNTPPDNFELLTIDQTNDGGYGVGIRYLDSPLLDVFTGVTVTGSAMTLPGGASSVDDFYTGCIVKSVGVTGETRTIIAYNGTTKVATLDRPTLTGTAGIVSIFGASNPRLDTSLRVRALDGSGNAVASAAGLNATSAGVLAAINASFVGTTTALSATNAGINTAIGASSAATLLAINASYAGTIAAIAATAAGTSAPTVGQIDTQLSGTHGSGLWGSGGGDGSVSVDQDLGGTDNLRVMSGGIPVDNATVQAFLQSDWDAGNRTAVYIKARTTTNVNGRWVSPMMLDPAAYTFIAFKQGILQIQAINATVT